MRLGSLICVLLTLAGCPGGGGSLGDRCGHNADCKDDYQCVANTCVLPCQRAPECGDGYRCDDEGFCIAATGEQGDACSSEVDCVAGLSCKIEGNAVNEDGYLLASCSDENAGRPAGLTCSMDAECRNGTCDLGHCVDLCSVDRDCGAGTKCTDIPRVASDGMLYRGCLQSKGALRWTIPVQGASDDVLLPVPQIARSLSVYFNITDPTQKVGATHITTPNGTQILEPSLDYYANVNVRHRLEFGQSVLGLPVAPDEPGERYKLQTGVYKLTVASKRVAFGDRLLPGTATPAMTAVIKVDDNNTLDLHFYFLNFDEHPCANAFNGRLDAQTAQIAPFFQDEFLIQGIKPILAAGGIQLGAQTYTDLRNHPDLDALDVSNLTSLLALGEHSVGINVFFVRTLSPVGLQAAGPNPGPAGLAKTKLSGIVIGLDTLCYRSWGQLARLTTREIARYMGLYENVEVDPTHLDPLDDTDASSSNLMFYSELGGRIISPKQLEILRKSAVLR